VHATSNARPAPAGGGGVLGWGQTRFTRAGGGARAAGAWRASGRSGALGAASMGPLRCLRTIPQPPDRVPPHFRAPRSRAPVAPRPSSPLPRPRPLGAVRTRPLPAYSAIPAPRRAAGARAAPRPPPALRAPRQQQQRAPQQPWPTRPAARPKRSSSAAPRSSRPPPPTPSRGAAPPRRSAGVSGGRAAHGPRAGAPPPTPCTPLSPPTQAPHRHVKPRPRAEVGRPHVQVRVLQPALRRGGGDQRVPWPQGGRVDVRPHVPDVVRWGFGEGL
jgi:hypothetical protein